MQMPLVPGSQQSMVVCLWLIVVNCSVFVADWSGSLGPEFLLEHSDRLLWVSVEPKWPLKAGIFCQRLRTGREEIKLVQLKQ